MCDEQLGCVNCLDDSDCGETSFCVERTCAAGECSETPLVYGDATGDQTVDIFDIFCVLDGFQGVFDDCTIEEVDIAGCAPDGAVDILDIFAVLDAFVGIDGCCGGP